MPKYNFACNICFEPKEMFLSLTDYLNLKNTKIKCEKCVEGVLSQQIISINSSIEKTQDQIIMESKEEIRKTVDKIKAGDQRAMDDIYGDRLNPHKK